jgi:hypothetical protein
LFFPLGYDFSFFLSVYTFLYDSPWKRLHNEELREVYCSPNCTGMITTRLVRWVGHVARSIERRVAYMVLVGKYDGRRPLGKPSLKWENNIKIDLQEIGWWNEVD